MTAADDNFGPDVRRIPARSHAQLMDWSLVLASQGIEARIAEENDDCFVEVAAADFSRAEAAIDSYEKENPRWRWRRPLPVYGILFHWGSIFWCLGLLWIYFWATDRRAAIDAAGMMNNQAVSAGQWWRLFTAMTLHGDVAHLAANVTTGFLLMGLAMAQHGPGAGLLGAYLAGAGGNLAALWIYDSSHRGLGASGMVMGALGLISMQKFRFSGRISFAARLLLRAIATGLLLFLLMGTTPGTDIVAHLGGFVFGLAIGFLLNFLPDESERKLLDRTFLLFVPVWVVLTWWLALNFS